MRTGKRGVSRGGGKEYTVNPNLIYCMREIWSINYPLWTRYAVELPRLPNENDRVQRWVDLSENQPKSLQGFVGNHNKDFFNHIDHLMEVFNVTHNLPDVLVFSGPSGSGKTASAKIFASKLIDEQNLSLPMSVKWCMQINARDFPVNDMMPMWNKITKFADQPLDKAFRASFRYVVIDNFDHVPPSSQQNLKKMMITFGNTLKYLFVCPDPRSCMVGFVLNKSTIYRTKSIGERDALSVILSICFRNRIGYDREGLQALFQHHTNFSLSEMIDTLQKVFVETEFVSMANVYRITGKVMDIPLIGPTEAIQPIERCKLCTLMPPCKHISEVELIKSSQERRKELPRYRDGSMTCPEFARFGHCSRFNECGHCSLDHPKNIHRVDLPVRRCPQCTIPWPCSHCSYHAFRNQLKDMIDEINTRLVRLRQINVPDPPLAFTRHLVSLLLRSISMNKWLFFFLTGWCLLRLERRSSTNRSQIQ